MRAITFAALLAVLAGAAVAWSPAAHYFFTCRALKPEMDLSECLAREQTLLSATEMPDGFASGGFLTGSKCAPQNTDLHSLVFAGYLYKAAQGHMTLASVQRHVADRAALRPAAPQRDAAAPRDLLAQSAPKLHAAGGPFASEAAFLKQVAAAQAEGSNGNASSMLMDVALGFGAHVAGDYAGFFKGGFLGRGGLEAPLGNMISLWKSMTAIDGLIINQVWPTYGRPAGAGRFGLPNFAVASGAKSGADNAAAVNAFFSKASAIFAAAYPAVQPIDSSVVGHCVHDWRLGCDVMEAEAVAMPAAVREWHLLYYSQHKANNTAQATYNFHSSFDCAVGAIQAWKAAIAQPATSPEAANDAVVQYLQAQTAAGRCA